MKIKSWNPAAGFILTPPSSHLSFQVTCCCFYATGELDTWGEIKTISLHVFQTLFLIHSLTHSLTRSFHLSAKALIEYFFPFIFFSLLPWHELVLRLTWLFIVKQSIEEENLCCIYHSCVWNHHHLCHRLSIFGFQSRNENYIFIIFICCFPIELLCAHTPIFWHSINHNFHW